MTIRSLPLSFACIALSVADVSLAEHGGGGRHLSPYCMGTSPVKTIKVEHRASAIIPAEIRVQEGDCVELWIKAVDDPVPGLVIEGTNINSYGAPLIDDNGNVYGRAVSRPNPQLFKAPAMIKEGEFLPEEQVRMMFNAKKEGVYRLRSVSGISGGDSGESRPKQNPFMQIKVVSR